MRKRSGDRSKSSILRAGFDNAETSAKTGSTHLDAEEADSREGSFALVRQRKDAALASIVGSTAWSRLVAASARCEPTRWCRGWRDKQSKNKEGNAS